MAEYTKPWLSIDEQMDKLESRGVQILDRKAGSRLLAAVGHYRVTGYLYPLRESEITFDANSRRVVQVHNDYHAGTTLDYAEELVAFDRRLRMLVLEGVEHIEISLRTQVAHVLGRRSAFAHLDSANFLSSFTESITAPDSGETSAGKHEQWIERVEDRRSESEEAFVAHFREKYDDSMPIWALTEILELGHLGKLYSGLNSSIATEIATTYGVPTKKMLSSWISCLNYVRNVSAHHVRLFNRKLVSAPARPSRAQVPLLGHLTEQDSAKQTFGVYNAVAVMAYLVGLIDEKSTWAIRPVDLIDSFPASIHLNSASMGFPEGWSTFELWPRT
ncbi:MAG: hypothetical protein JWR01_597 [Subtercola sp.]|nr:hypothetical protein [Subtercola sp.]